MRELMIVSKSVSSITACDILIRTRTSRTIMMKLSRSDMINREPLSHRCILFRIHRRGPPKHAARILDLKDRSSMKLSFMVEPKEPCTTVCK